MNNDLGTTILGGIIAAATAAQPVVTVAQGAWHFQEVFQLISAIGIALLGFFTNKSSGA